MNFILRIINETAKIFVNATNDSDTQRLKSKEIEILEEMRKKEAEAAKAKDAEALKAMAITITNQAQQIDKLNKKFELANKTFQKLGSVVYAMAQDLDALKAENKTSNSDPNDPFGDNR